MAHNASFDRVFFERFFNEFTNKPWLCSLNGVDWKREGTASNSLPNLAEHFGLPASVAHRADADVERLAQGCAT